MWTVSGMSRMIVNTYALNAKSGASRNGTGTASSMSEVLRKSAVMKNPAMKKKYAQAISNLQKKTGNIVNENKLSSVSSKLAGSAGELSSSWSLYKDDNREKLEKGVSDFVDNYNETVSALLKSDSESALSQGVSMVNTTRAFSSSLSKAGITVGQDNKLSIDKEKLAAADMNSIKSLFKGGYSYGAKIAQKASDISYAAKNEVNGTYNANGNLVQYSNNIIASLLSTNA